jgi:hypothetical protein
MGLLSSPLGTIGAALRAPLEALTAPAAGSGAGGGVKSILDDVPYCGTVGPRPPLPPLHHAVADLVGRAGDLASLNPQPLPPKEDGGLQHGVRFALDDWCGTVPPKPPIPGPGPGPVGPLVR